MMDAIGSATTTPLAGASGRASMSRDQFLKILVAELTTQDPLEPLDNSEFMQQLVGMQSLEQSAALTDSLKSFQSFMEMSAGSGMIGKTVKGLTASGGTVEGVVSRVTMEAGNVNLVVGSQKLSIASITEIKGQ